MTILAAVDGAREPDRVVNIGDELARAYDEELVVVHVMPEEQFDSIQRALNQQETAWSEGFAPYFGAGEPPQSGYFVDDAVEDAADIAENVTDATLDRRGDIQFVGRVGNPVEEILDVADDRGVRYIVIGGRKRTPTGKALFGSATQSILLNADCPVVTVLSE